MGPFETQLREFIRRLALTEADVRGNKRRAVALAQGVRDYAADGGRGGGQALVTFKGRILGVIDELLPHSFVRFEGATSHTDYGTYEATDGTYEVNLELATNEDLWLYYQGPTERFVECRRGGLTSGSAGIHELSDISAIEDEDNSDPWGGVNPIYTGCATLNIPLNRTLNFTDSRFSITNTLIGGAETLAVWVRNISAPNNTYQFFGDTVDSSGFQILARKPGGAGNIPNLWTSANSSISIASLPDGTPGGPKFDATWTWTSTDPTRSYVAGDTIRIWES